MIRLAKSHVEVTVFQLLREDTLLLCQSIDKMKISINSVANFQLSDSDVIPDHNLGTAVAQWLRFCATNRKVADSIPAGVSGFFIDIKYFRLHYGPGVDSASNRKEYQEHFLGVKAAGA